MGHVFRLHSTLELPLEDLEAFLEAPDLPAEIDAIEFTRRNNTLILRADADDESISKYTPTAQLKASVTEVRVYEDEEEEEEGPPTSGPPAWDRDEPRPSELVEYAAFKGDRETVLQNTALQYPMFEVLYQIALRSEKGELTAITSEDGELVATRIVEGEEVPATVEVAERPRREQAAATGVDWRDNEFIGN
jgi:hypothetical protein